MAGSSWMSISGGKRMRPQCFTSLGVASEMFVIRTRGRLPPRHGILHLATATRDIDHTHVRVEDLEPFRLSRAGHTDVQDGEVEMRDTVPPQLMHEPHVASFQVPRQVEVT